jgi:hypothetical protein
MTILTKIQTDAQNAESDVVKLILGKMDQAVINLDKSKSQPANSVNGSPLQIVDGKGVYHVSTSKDGIFSWTGAVQVKQTDGSMKEYRTATQTYQVARPCSVA